MDGSTDCHTEYTKSDREGQRNDIAYVWNLKKKKGTNEFIKKIERVIEGENKSWFRKQSN